MKRWFHVVSYDSAWGFAINENGVVVDVAIAHKELMGKSVKDAELRKWFTESNLIITEVKASQSEQVQMADLQ